ncbi:MAG: hypothetical protein Q4B63_01700 [Clostridium perfringens]|nr:hypothetical protein [Clostridium perfringens]
MKKKGLIILVTALVLGSLNLTGGENIVLGTSLNSDVLNNLTNGESSEENSGNQNKVDTQVSNIQPKKILIESVKIDKEKVEPGDEFILTYTLVNNTNAKLHNTSLKIASIEGKGTLEGFVPIGTTNEIYVGTINAGAKKEVSIRLYSDKNLKAGAYNFITSVTYNEDSKDQEEITKLSGIVLKSKAQLELSEIDAFENGEGYTLSGNLVNAGDTKLKNVDVKVNLNGNVYSYQASTIKTEEEEMFEINLPSVLEDTEASISINYEDDSKNTYVTESKYMVKAVALETSATMEEYTEESTGFWGFIRNLFGFGA